jgi:hypothetical protein
MTPEEIQNHISEAVSKGLEDHLPAAVQTAVNTAVNGKINALRAELKPVIDAFNKWGVLKSAVAGVFLPLTALAAFMASVAVTVHYLFPRK